MSSVGLVMIVRDGEKTLPRCLSSVTPFVEEWAVVDTGSQDGTEAVVKKYLDFLPGKLWHKPWVSFGFNRTQAVSVARQFLGTDYLLMVDADTAVVWDGQPLDLTADVHELSVLGFPFSFRQPLLYRRELDWRYVGSVHECLVGGSLPAVPAVPFDGLKVMGYKSEDQEEKNLRYLELLMVDYAKDPLNTRTLFYLGQVHRDLGNVDRAINFFRLRADLRPTGDEAFYARYQLGCLLCDHVSFDKGEPELARAWREYPHRVEPLRALANAATNLGNKISQPEGLFVHGHLYRPYSEPGVVSAG